MPERKPIATTTPVLDRPLTDELDANASSNGTDTLTDQEGNSEGAGEGESTKAAKRNLDDAPDDEIVGITLRVPNGFRKLLASKAVEQNTSVPQMLAQMSADAFEYTLPKPERAPRLKKYDSPEDRKAAQKTDQRRQRLIARKVMESVEKGIINVDMAAVMAEVEAELKAAAEHDAAATAAATATTTAS